ncbi:AMP-binding protein [Actinomadura madurae]|uniref:AMP-binding protein n=1 Tax=Actinomadura madurae TaxID=1993 RepID=UPI0020D21E1F|nr:AMP-binding protein [Actinomadura madurae]MCQ0005384.1 AMP-binding protein [Actinomadura madurae]
MTERTAVLGDDRPAREAAFAELVAARGDDDRTGLCFEDLSWTWREVVEESRCRASLVRDLDGHVGLFLENGPEHLFWLLGAALAGVPVVELNPTRRGAELARDITHTDCALLVTETSRTPLLEDLADVPSLNVDAPAYTERVSAPPAATSPVAPETIFSLVFTSGTTSAPKAVICTQGRLGRIAVQQRDRRGLTRDDVFYVVMPMFHSNALMAGIAPAVATGGRVVLRRKFSASGFLPDVRRFGVTFFNYVGRPLSYILATPEKPSDADNTLRIAFGNEANERDIAEFARRFGCTVIDSYGSSEGEIRLNRVPGTPPGSLGVAEAGTIVADPATLRECPRAEFDADGVLLNARRGHRRDRRHDGRRQVRGLLQQPRGDGPARPRRLDLVGRPRLPRRGRATGTSPAATTTGCAWTARTSRRPRSNASCPASTRSRTSPSTPSRTSTSATR